MRIALNPRYLLEALRVMDAKEVRCCFTGPVGPACLQAKEDDEGFLYVVLPIRVDE